MPSCDRFDLTRPSLYIVLSDRFVLISGKARAVCCKTGQQNAVEGYDQVSRYPHVFLLLHCGGNAIRFSPSGSPVLQNGFTPF
jgi:hypothetical protein